MNTQTQINTNEAELVSKKDSVITLENVSVSYSGNKAVKGVSFNVAENKITSIIGPSGCGKSTLLKGIIGLPANLFYGTGIPAAIIVIDKENASARSGIFMIDASKGFKKDWNIPLPATLYMLEKLQKSSSHFLTNP